MCGKNRKPNQIPYEEFERFWQATKGMSLRSAGQIRTGPIQTDDPIRVFLDANVLVVNLSPAPF